MLGVTCESLLWIEIQGLKLPCIKSAPPFGERFLLYLKAHAVLQAGSVTIIPYQLKNTDAIPKSKALRNQHFPPNSLTAQHWADATGSVGG